LRLNDAVSATDDVLDAVKPNGEFRAAFHSLVTASSEVFISAEHNWRRETVDLHALSAKLVGEMVAVVRRMEQ